MSTVKAQPGTSAAQGRKVTFYPADEVDDALFKYAVIACRHSGRWVMCRHRLRESWEIPGGHREPGEPIADAARRELYEETGATEFSLNTVCAYSVSDGPGEVFGILFYADITALGELPQSEIAQVGLFADMPACLTYPDILPRLWEQAEEFIAHGK